MKKTSCVLIMFLALAACSGPSYYNKPADFIGGNRAAAMHLHCARKIGDNKDNTMYKLCEQSFITHYGK